ncbi:hypothetical protein mRhiFer1_008868 [Rhinolophus ferrumequinum]|uniref:Uncharacterized protein n=1 Tax=Rhinolophus ferrumequinum TaxID=59479 RepID=A0A7J8AF35_RHIFE|nr:hypothetical protein mRhiFer1_008868 [Rhinolophus ferrumequinum]
MCLFQERTLGPCRDTWHRWLPYCASPVLRSSVQALDLSGKMLFQAGYPSRQSLCGRCRREAHSNSETPMKLSLRCGNTCLQVLRSWVVFRKQTCGKRQQQNKKPSLVPCPLDGKKLSFIYGLHVA